MFSKPSPARSTAAPAAPARHAPAPTPAAAPTPAPAMSSGGMGSGLMGTMVSGMAFGAGSEVGHMAVKSLMGGGSSGHSEPAQ